MSCTIDCVHPTPTQAHCAVANCHRTFGAVSGFDRHRRHGHCLNPATLGMVETAGVWRIPISDADRARLAKIRDADSRVRIAPQSDETGLRVPPATPGVPNPADSRTGGRP